MEITALTFSATHIAIYSLLMVLNGIFSTPPSEFVAGTAGITEVSTLLDATMVALILASSNTVGHGVLYFLGRKYLRYSDSSLNVKLKLIINKYRILQNVYSPDRVEYLLHVLRTKGMMSVLIVRLLPMIRSIYSVPCGMAGLPKEKYFLFTIGGNMMWCTFWVFGGWMFREAWEGASRLISILLFCILVVLVLIVWWKLTRNYKEWKQNRLADLNLSRSLDLTNAGDATE